VIIYRMISGMQKVLGDLINVSNRLKRKSRRRNQITEHSNLISQRELSNVKLSCVSGKRLESLYCKWVFRIACS
jgi:hypothetical protein